MAEPDFLVVELLREGGEVTKKVATAGGVKLAAMAMLADSKTLRPGDRLTVRVPIEGEDIPSRE